MKLALSLFASAAFLVSSASFAQDTFGQPSQQPQQPQYPAQQPGQHPQQPAYPAQQPAYPGQQPMQPGGGDLDQLAQMERQDYGVQPVSQLHAGAMHGPTPASIPGGQVVTTKGVIDLIQGTQVRGLIFDVLGGPETLPGALAAAPASQPGSFNDQTQQEFGGFLQQQTQGNKQTPLVFYCQSTQCWMSYNASLRAINMGYTNVLWYRGGIEAWKMAGQQTQPQGQQPQLPQQQPAQRPSPY
ncbi:MAG: rhodanese-like domain-containing protein [Amphiplicatus sp.]